MLFGLFSSGQNTSFPPVKLFNSESRKLEIFEPLTKNKVKLYTCGPTVYDYATIGNLRAYIFADILKRTLEVNGYNVNHTINFTDFGHLTSDADSGEDKMMKGLAREGMDLSIENMRLLSDRYIAAFKKDCEALDILPPTQWARASEYVSQQIKLIETLDEKGYTYTTSDGVYFDVSKFPTYGRLGNIDIEGLKSGARVEENTEKKHPADFAVWKNGELGWESRWGKGFPGWHIECSAMAFATLGKQIDIHTGGVDNAPTHHNGEIAQSEAATGKQFSKYWLHSEHVQLNSERIAKSTGNTSYISDLVDAGFTALDYRYWLMTAHYRSKVNFSLEALSASTQALSRLKRLMYEDWAGERGSLNANYHDAFIAAVNDDLDTPKAISIMWDLVKDETVPNGDKKMTILVFDDILAVGLSLSTEDGLAALGQIANNKIPEELKQLIQEREAARAAQNWMEADRLRDALEMKGFTIEDGPEGPKLTKI